MVRPSGDRKPKVRGATKSEYQAKLMIDLDVVVVNWNAGNQLSDCLLSLALACQNSVFQLSKCTVVDNASTDGSTDSLGDLPLRPELIKNRANAGFATASNQGASAGSASYILFLNPDVRLFPDSLTKPLLFLSEPANAALGILGVQLVDEDGTIQRNVARFPTPGDLFFQMLGFDRLWPRRFPPLFLLEWDHAENRAVDQVPGAFFLVRRSLFERLHGFDQRFFMYFEDLDLAYRASQAGFGSYYLADARVFHRGGGTTVRVKANRLFYILRSRAQYVAKHYGVRAGLEIILACISVEFWMRFLWSWLRFSPKNSLETVQAYLMFLKDLPKLLKELEAG